jgi:hypothetical protein
MKGIRVHYSEQGWIIDVPYALNQKQIYTAIEYHKKIQKQRIKFMKGDKRENCIKALNDLNINTLKQNILPNMFNEYMVMGGQ